MNFNIIFNRVKLWFGLPAVVPKDMGPEEFLKAVGSDTIAAVGGGIVMYNTKYMTEATSAGTVPEALVENITSHELGHMYYLYESPGKFANKVRDMINVEKVLGLTGDAAHLLLNVVYDSTLDVLSFDRGVYTSVPVVTTMNHVSPPPEGQPLDKGGQYLMAFREVAEDVTLAGGGALVTDEVREVAKGIVEIIRQPLMETVGGQKYDSQESKTMEMAKRIAHLIGIEDQKGKGKGKGKGGDGKLTEEQKEALGEILKKLAEEGKIGEAKSAEEADGDIEGALADLDLKDGKVAKIAAGLLGIPQDEMGFHLVWNDAAKAIRFNIPFRGLAEGEKIKAYDSRWNPGMPVRDIDVQATMLRHGKFIPGVTTLQGQYVPGPGVPKEEGFPNMFISVDCSGSMETSSPYPGRPGSNHDLVSATIYALMHEAKKRRTKVCACLWADRYWTSPLGSNYEAIGKDVWRKVGAVGGGNSVGGLKPLRDKIKAGDLLVYVTDFQLNREDQEEAKADLQYFISRGAEVAFIAMFNHDAGRSGISYVECKTLQDLEGIALKSAREHLHN